MNALLNIEGIKLFCDICRQSAQHAQTFCDQKAGAGLEHALAACLLLNRISGFLKDDLKQLKRFLLLPEKPDALTFVAQHNSAREKRFAGAGRHVPPAGIQPENGGCIFCNVWWQQSGMEIGYRYAVSGIPFVAYPNPFPFGDSHFTHATAMHRPQSWLAESPADSLANLRRNVTYAIAHAVATPERVVFFNDESAGASVPAHFHLQSILRHDGYGCWPLEMAAARSRGTASVEALFIADYPIGVVHWSGTKEQVLSSASKWLGEWFKASGALKTLRVHIIATTEIGNPERVQLFIAPRDSRFPFSPLMNGAVGSLEVLGEFVFCTEIEREMLVSGRINQTTARQILASVEPCGQREILKVLCPR